MKCTLVFVFLALAGCATQKQIYLPSGETGYSINCSGSALTWEHCYAQAGKICATRGYEVLARDDEQGSTSSPLFGTTTHFRTMLIVCK